MEYAFSKIHNSVFKIDRKDLTKYMVIVIYMTPLKLAASRRYGSQIFRTDIIAGVLSTDKFQTIAKYLQLPPVSQPTPNTSNLEQIVHIIHSIAGKFPEEKNWTTDQCRKVQKNQLSVNTTQKIGAIHKLEPYG